jgi:DNA polymerase-3 subunit alpha
VPPSNRNQIRYGLCAIKGAGSAAIQSIIDSRLEKEDKRFTGFLDFLESINHKVVNKKVLENLIKCGALDWTEIPRRSLLEGLPGATAEALRVQRDKETGQTSLFSMFESPEDIPQYRVPDKGEWGTGPKMVQEKNALGFCLTGNPLDAYRDVEKKLNFVLAREAREAHASTSVILLGNIVSCRIMASRRGSDMAILTVQCRDETMDAMFFGDEFQNAKRLLFSKSAIALYGTVEKRKSSDDDEVVKTSIKGERIIELGEIREQQSKNIFIALQEKDLTNEKINSLYNLLENSVPGFCTLGFTIHYPQKGITQLKSPYKIKPTEEFLNNLEETFGRATIWSIT